jgi:hypothetical protein
MKLTTVECVEACPLALDKHAVLLQHGDVVLGAPLGNHVVAECEEQVSNLAIGFVTTGLEADYRFTNFNIGVENCGIRSNLLRDNISLEENVAYNDESLVPHLEMSTRDRPPETRGASGARWSRRLSTASVHIINHKMQIRELTEDQPLSVSPQEQTQCATARGSHGGQAALLRHQLPCRQIPQMRSLLAISSAVKRGFRAALPSSTV